MISLVTDENQPLFEHATEFHPVGGSRIATMHKAYGNDCRDVLFWVQTKAGNQPCAAIARFWGRLIISPDNSCDKDELIAFARAVGGFHTLDAPLSFCEGLGDGSGFTVMEHRGRVSEILADITDTPGLREVFALLNEVDSDFRDFINWPEWYVHTSHLLRHGLGICCGIMHEGSLVATGGIYAIGPTHALIGGVATYQELRGCGFGRSIVAYLATRAYNMGKIPVLLCASPGLRDWYAGQGFYVLEQDWGEFTVSI